MTENTLPVDRIQSLNLGEQFDFINLYNEVNQTDLIEDSPFTEKPNIYTYYTPDNFANTFHQTNKSTSLFCMNCRSLNAILDAIQELLYAMCADDFAFDLIALTEVFNIIKRQMVTTNYNLIFVQTRMMSMMVSQCLSSKITQITPSEMTYQYSSHT